MTVLDVFGVVLIVITIVSLAQMGNASLRSGPTGDPTTLPPDEKSNN